MDEFERLRSHRNGSNLKHLPSKLSCVAALYLLWKEMNGRVFRNASPDVQHVIHGILADIRAYVSSWRKLRKTDDNRLISMDWNISFRVFEVC